MAVKVTTKIKSVLTDQGEQVALGVDAVQALLEELRKQILIQLATGASSYSSLHMRQTLNSFEKYVTDFESAADRELGSGIIASFDAGAALLPAALEAGGESGVYFGMGHASSQLIETLQEFSYGRIKSVAGDLYTKIKGELTLGILGQKSPQEVASEIAGELVKNKIPMPMMPDRFGNVRPIFKSAAERAEVITQTEMGRAFSMATQKSIETASETVDDLLRMWLHAGHPKAPRQVHLLMHGQVRGMKNPFYQAADGTPVMYPRDPGAPISEVIRCGCILVPYKKTWGTAEDFAANFDATAHRVETKKPTEE